VEIYVMASDGSHPQRLTHHPPTSGRWSGRRTAGPCFLQQPRRQLEFVFTGNSEWKFNSPDHDPATNASRPGRPMAGPLPLPPQDENWDIFTLPAPTGPAAEIPRSQ